METKIPSKKNRKMIVTDISKLIKSLSCFKSYFKNL